MTSNELSIEDIRITLTRVNGIPIDVASFSAGVQLGMVFSMLKSLAGANGAMSCTVQLDRELLEQADLIAMNFGFTTLEFNSDELTDSVSSALVRFALPEVLSHDSD